ncbi:glycosyltransferase [Pelagibius litoralis]|uniref:Glycosyltransferase n=2 Tax=Pelagibius litoralis TaxID=374515 RepID=A0A967F2A2_9PROT|nr:glycosyltransferase [Pelagibius litoralis]
MARAPRLGTVKRRLARDIGTVGALRFYRGHTAGLLRDLSADPRWRLWLAVTPDSAALSGRGLWPFHGDLLPQGRGDLGRRMGRLFETLPPGPLVMIGSDIPGITRAHIGGAFKSLGAADWVFGPAEDGGYWLVGARRRPVVRPPFDGVRWSSAATLDDTLANLKDVRVALLDRLRDVDTGADLQLLRDQAAR